VKLQRRSARQSSRRVESVLCGLPASCRRAALCDTRTGSTLATGQVCARGLRQDRSGLPRGTNASRFCSDSSVRGGRRSSSASEAPRPSGVTVLATRRGKTVRLTTPEATPPPTALGTERHGRPLVIRRRDPDDHPEAPRSRAGGRRGREVDGSPRRASLWCRQPRPPGRRRGSETPASPR
jgi:hypothetical protein